MSFLFNFTDLIVHRPALFTSIFINLTGYSYAQNKDEKCIEVIDSLDDSLIYANDGPSVLPCLK